MILADQWMYDLIENHKEGFKQEDFDSRYSEILTKYDYIVGDWGYGQLRLKGFYEDKNQKANFDTRISTLQDYLYEYCNFGCAYFVLKKMGKAKKTEEIVNAETNQEEVTIEEEQTKTTQEQ